MLGPITEPGYDKTQIIASLAGTLERLTKDPESSRYPLQAPPEEYDSVIENLIDAISCCSPPYTSCWESQGVYGIWIDDEELTNAYHDGDLCQVDDLSKVPDGWTSHVLVVNDHGNMTLYTPVIEYREEWSVV